MKTRKIPTWCMVAFLLFAALTDSAAQQIHRDPAWHGMERARIAFENGELGTSLALCENARILHANTYAEYARKLSDAVSPVVLKTSGGDLQAIRSLLERRNENEAVAILDMVLSIHDKQYFDNSFSKLFSWLEKRVVYPEADMLSGDIYTAEGEYSLAMKHYLSAWENRDLLNIPQQRITLCYRMAEVEKFRGNHGAQEQYLLLVLAEDPLYGTTGNESGTLQAIKRTLESPESCDKFFTLYRHHNYSALPAYQDLTDFYYRLSGKRLEHALSTAALAAVISVTMLDEFLAKKILDYQFVSFQDLMIKAAAYPDILEEADRRNLWQTFLELSRILSDRQNDTVARCMLEDLSGYCPDTGIAGKANALLRENTN